MADWEETALRDGEEVALRDWEEAALRDWEEVASAVAAGVNGGKAHWRWPRAAMDRRAAPSVWPPARVYVPCRDSGDGINGDAGADVPRISLGVETRDP
jgi:hypothetical protein